MLGKKCPQQPQQQTGVINIVDVVKQANVQMKYEEMGSWLALHKTPLFFCHEKGFSVVDNKFIEERKWLKEALGKMVKDIEKQKPRQEIQPAPEETREGYIG